MPKTEVWTPNAIPFVFDPTNKNVLIPLYLDRELTASNSTCVSIGIQAEVDGETVSLNIESNSPPAEL